MRYNHVHPYSLGFLLEKHATHLLGSMPPRGSYFVSDRSLKTVVWNMLVSRDRIPFSRVYAACTVSPAIHIKIAIAYSRRHVFVPLDPSSAPPVSLPFLPLFCLSLSSKKAPHAPSVKRKKCNGQHWSRLDDEEQPFGGHATSQKRSTAGICVVLIFCVRNPQCPWSPCWSRFVSPIYLTAQDTFPPAFSRAVFTLPYSTPKSYHTVGVAWSEWGTPRLYVYTKVNRYN